MDKIERDEYHWTKCKREWDRWARKASLNRGQPNGVAFANDEEMDVDLN